MRSRASWISGALLVAAALVLVAVDQGSAQRKIELPRAVSAAAKPLSHPSLRPPAGPPGAARPASALFGNWGRGSWCWFADPRAVHLGDGYDDTFAGWIDWSGAIVVGSYSESSGAITTHVVGHMFHDDHSSPAIFAEPDDRLTVFFSAHNGSRLYYRTTVRPADISAWGPIEHVPSRLKGGYGFTYPNPILLPAERDKMYLFWRGATWSADYATRSPSGRWSPARVLITNPGNRPYLKVASNDSNTIALAFTNGHPRNTVTSVFYAAYRHGSLWTARGRRIARMPGPSIEPQQADLVYDGDATGVPSWVWDVAFDSHDHPDILYATFPSPDNHAYWYAHFNGRRWVSHFMTFAGPTISPGGLETEYSGGMALDHSNPSVVYLSRKVRGWFEIERWVTHDGGSRWTHRTVVRTPGADDVRPVVTRGLNGGPMSLMWLHGNYGNYVDYHTSVWFRR